MEEILNLLQALALPNYDNGASFTVRDRLDAVAEALKGTEYEKINGSGLFELYGRKGELPRRPVVLSTHIDCASSLTEFYARDLGDGTLRGTFDNLVTNALAVYLMRENALDSKVLVAFTGDEEENSRGAWELVDDLRARGCEPTVLVLDVTDMGWKEGAQVTVENNFWEDPFGRRVVEIARNASVSWRFVPSDPDEIPAYVPASAVIPLEAECDESWDYDEMGLTCFSLCIPVFGPMHANRGVLLRKDSLTAYARLLSLLTKGL